MARLIRQLLFIIVILAASAGSVQAVPSYDAVRSSYRSLKASDPQVTNIKRWEAVGSELADVIEANRGSETSAKAMYLAGRLYSRIFQARSSRSALSRAVFYFEQIAKEFGGNSLADDALLYLGDLRREGYRNEAAARAAYFEILDVYPQGDMVAQAKRRLRIEGGHEAVERERSAPPPAPTPRPTVKPSGAGDSGKEIVKKRVRIDRPLIVIDPGHGGDDLGAVGYDGYLEKDVVLNIAMLLDELLRERLRARTVLTRVRDVPLALEDRTEIANNAKADLFISIHANASPSRRARGIETYYLDNTDDKSSLKLAERENKSSRRNLSDVQFILSDLIQNVKLEDSIALAHHMQNALVQRISRYYSDVRDLGVKRGPFFVLVGAHMPCVLVEVSFMDHPVEGRRLIDRRYQKIVADALYRGIRGFFEHSS